MPDLSTYWDRVKETLSYYVGGVYRYTFEKDIFLWAQAIAFKVLITVVPILILTTGIVGHILSNVLQDANAFDDVARFVREYMPAFDQSDQLLAFVSKLQSTGTFYAGLGSVALVFAAMTLFTTLRVVIGNIFQEEWHRHRSVFGGYAFDIRMAIQVGLLFILTIGLSFLTTWIQQGGIEIASEYGLDYVWLREGWRRTFRFLSILIPYMLSTAMFFQLFYFIPQPRPPKRSALLGAVVTGLLWEVAKVSFTLYAASAGQFERYTATGTEAEEMIGMLGQAFGLIIAFVFWVYYSGIVLTIGALIAVLNEKRVRTQRIRRERERMENALAAQDDEGGPAGGEPHAQKHDDGKQIGEQRHGDEAPKHGGAASEHGGTHEGDTRPGNADSVDASESNGAHGDERPSRQDVSIG